LAVVGSRSFRNYPLLKKTLDRLRQRYEVKAVISGGAQGADKLAERYARECGLDLQVLKPDWSKGRGAGLARNTEIVALADYVVAFWDRKSAGTKDTIGKTRQCGKTLQLVEF
jgi:hypothetical protein